MARAVVWATLVAGTVDILYAALMSVIFGRGPATMLRGVASGPFPGASDWGTLGSLIGLAVHFILMAIMVTYFMIAARNWPLVTSKPVLAGIVYGLITYVVMNWIVVPLRFDTPLPPQMRAVVSQLFAHIVLVGLPISIIAAKMVRPRILA